MVGDGNEQAAAFAARARPARRRRVGRAQRARGRRRLHGARRRSVDAGRAARGPADRRDRAGPRRYYVRGSDADRQGRPAAARQSPRGRAGRPDASGPPQDHRPMDGRAAAGRSVRPDGPRRARPPRSRPSAPRPPTTTSPSDPTSCRSRRRLRQPRTILSIVVPLVLIAIFVCAQRRPARRGPGAPRCRPTRRCCCSRSAIFYLGFPLRGLRWALLLRGTGVDVGDARLDRDHLPVVARELPRPGQARRRLSRLPAEDQHATSRSAGRSARCSSSGSSTCSRSRSSAWPPASGASGAGCRRRSRSSFAIGVVVVVVLAVGLLTHAQLRAADPRSRLPLPHRVLELYDRFEEGVFGAIGLRGLPALARPDRADLGDRGAAPVLRRPGARLPRRHARDLGRVLRGADRVAADRGAAQPGGPRASWSRASSAC